MPALQAQVAHRFAPRSGSRRGHGRCGCGAAKPRQSHRRRLGHVRSIRSTVHIVPRRRPGALAGLLATVGCASASSSSRLGRALHSTDDACGAMSKQYRVQPSTMMLWAKTSLLKTNVKVSRKRLYYAAHAPRLHPFALLLADGSPTVARARASGGRFCDRLMFSRRVVQMVLRRRFNCRA